MAAGCGWAVWAGTHLLPLQQYLSDAGRVAGDMAKVSRSAPNRGLSQREAMTMPPALPGGAPS